MTQMLNLGVLAHVDAGKTSLTERLLYTSGAIPALGSVDTGTTHTDTLPMEQQRGITIRAAVASFSWHDLQVNLIDTPGHPDFIAEVERSLSVLDAVILVVSSVEGVQPQTRRLARAIRAIGLPCIIFCNKIDRLGARDESLISEIESKLGWPVLPVTSVLDIGTKNASVHRRDLMADESAVELLADHDESLLERWVNGEANLNSVHEALLNATRSGEIVPITFGSAVTGAGVEPLLDMLAWLAPNHELDEELLSAQVFKIERDNRGERMVLLRIWSGTLRTRVDCLVQHGDADPESVGKITRLDRATPGGYQMVMQASAGDIVRVHGFSAIHVGDVIGAPPPRFHDRFFLPVFETVVCEQQIAQRHALRMALADLADQDPFISLRFDVHTATTSVRLFGDVQKDVIESTLMGQYGIPVEFAESIVICIERPVGTGEALERITGDLPFYAGVGLRITAGPAGSGVRYTRSQQSLGRLPHAMYLGIEDMAIATVREGLVGWEVTDIVIELTFVEYYDAASTVGDFRGLTPLVVMQALQQAGTEVCEPIQRFRLEVPEECLADAIRLLVQHRAVIAESIISGDIATIEGEIPAAEISDFERYLPGISRGEGDCDHWHANWQPVHGEVPVRSRTDFNPLNRVEYLSRLSGRM